MPALIGLADAKKFLNITRTADDAELQTVLDDAVAAIGDLIGPLGATASYTEEIYHHGVDIVLSATPAVALTQVQIEPWLGAAAIDDTANWRLNARTGVARRMLQGGTLPFLGPGSVFTVTYTYGWTDIPSPVNRAVLMQVGHMWKTQRGSMPLPAGGMDDGLPPWPGGMGFLHPDVMELLLPYLRPPGVG